MGIVITFILATLLIALLYVDGATTLTVPKGILVLAILCSIGGVVYIVMTPGIQMGLALVSGFTFGYCISSLVYGD